MVSPNDQPMRLETCAMQMGMELAVEHQNITGAMGQLDVNLATLGCEPSIDTTIIQGSWQSDRLYQNTPPFTRAVRAATNAIIFREHPTASIPLSYPSISDMGGGDFSEAVMAWMDNQVSVAAELLMRENARFLIRFRGGLALRGYAQRDSGRDMREEFDEVIDSLWADNDEYDLMRSKVVERMMQEAELKDVRSVIRSAQRVRRYSRRYGVIPGLRRATETNFVPRIPRLPVQ